MAVAAVRGDLTVLGLDAALTDLEAFFDAHPDSYYLDLLDENPGGVATFLLEAKPDA